MATTQSGVTPGRTASTVMTNIQKIAIEKALFTTEAERIMPRLVQNFKLGKGEYQTNIPRFDRVTASAAAEGQDFATPSTISLNSVNVITGEHVCMVNITTKLARQMTEDSARVAGKLLGDGLSRLREGDLLGLFSGFSNQSGGTTETPSISDIRHCVAFLQSEQSASYGAARPPYFCVAHPGMVKDFVQDLTAAEGYSSTTASYRGGLGYVSMSMTGDDVLRSYLSGRDKVYNVQIYSHPLIPLDSSEDAHGAVFAGDALAYVESLRAETWIERDNSARADEYGIVGDWREAELVDTWGCDFFYNATTATLP